MKCRLLPEGGWRAHRLGIQIMCIYMILGIPLYVKSWSNWIGPAACYIPTAACVVMDPTAGGCVLRTLDRLAGVTLGLFLAMVVSMPVYMLGHTTIDGSVDVGSWLKWFFYANGILCAFFWGYLHFCFKQEKHLLLILSGITTSLFMYAPYGGNWMWSIWMNAICNWVGCIGGCLIVKNIVPQTVAHLARDELGASCKNLAILSYVIVDAFAGDGTAAHKLTVDHRMSKLLDGEVSCTADVANAEGKTPSALKTTSEGELTVKEFEDMLSEKMTATWMLLNAQSIRYRGVAWELISKKGRLEEARRHHQVVAHLFQIFQHLVGLKEMLMFKSDESLLFSESDEGLSWLTRSPSIVNAYLSCSRLDLAAASAHAAAALEYKTPSVAHVVSSMSLSSLRNKSSAHRLHPEVAIPVQLDAPSSEPVSTAYNTPVRNRSPERRTPPGARELIDSSWKAHCDLVEEVAVARFGPSVSRVERCVTKILTALGEKLRDNHELDRAVMKSLEKEMVSAEEALFRRYGETNKWLRRILEYTMRRIVTGGAGHEDVRYISFASFPSVQDAATSEEVRWSTEDFVDYCTGLAVEEFMSLPPQVRLYIWRRSSETNDRICAIVTLLQSLCMATRALYKSSTVWASEIAPADCCKPRPESWSE